MNKFVDRIFYINLEHRNDRKEQIETEIRKFDPYLEITERFDAINVKPASIRGTNGAIGCSMSHCKIVQIAKERGYKNILILEDDFQFIAEKERLLNNLRIFYENIDNFHLILLGTNCAKFYDTQYPDIYKVSNSQTASGYIINNSVYDDFLKIADLSIDNLNKTQNETVWAIDQAWKILQGENKKVYSFNKIERIGIQRPSYSDIVGNYVNYGC